MSETPTLEEIVQAVDALALRKRKRVPQGRKPKYTDSSIIALTVYQKLSGFRYAQQMLGVLASLNQDVPAPSTFAERKAGLIGQLILAVKQLCSGVRATKQHLDSKKLEVVDVTRANRTNLAGRYGYDHITDGPEPLDRDPLALNSVHEQGLGVKARDPDVGETGNS